MKHHVFIVIRHTCSSCGGVGEYLYVSEDTPFMIVLTKRLKDKQNKVLIFTYFYRLSGPALRYYE